MSEQTANLETKLVELEKKLAKNNRQLGIEAALERLRATTGTRNRLGFIVEL